MRKQRRRDLFKRRKKHRSEKKSSISSAGSRKLKTRRKYKYSYDYSNYDDYEEFDYSDKMADGPHNPPKRANTVMQMAAL